MNEPRQEFLSPVSTLLRQLSEAEDLLCFDTNGYLISPCSNHLPFFNGLMKFIIRDIEPLDENTQNEVRDIFGEGSRSLALNQGHRTIVLYLEVDTVICRNLHTLCTASHRAPAKESIRSHLAPAK